MDLRCRKYPWKLVIDFQINMTGFPYHGSTAGTAQAGAEIPVLIHRRHLGKESINIDISFKQSRRIVIIAGHDITAPLIGRFTQTATGKPGNWRNIRIGFGRQRSQRRYIEQSMTCHILYFPGSGPFPQCLRQDRWNRSRNISTAGPARFHTGGNLFRRLFLIGIFLHYIHDNSSFQLQKNRQHRVPFPKEIPAAHNMRRGYVRRDLFFLTSL